MPKLYEYFGLILFFYANEHEPIHVHGRYGEDECRAEFTIENGLVTHIAFRKVKGRRPLTGRKLRDFEEFCKSYAGEIVRKWIQFFILREKLKPEIVTRRLP